ncbi:MAG TPA: thiamine pyrophosphate-dependent enzyme [candidate division Zixibacteria bacterium]|nr:thiamine pyrophosphate-dependent enzyme [candidate division Zixibacteria bacterium]
MRRIDCLRALAAHAAEALVVTSAGATTLEWNAVRPGDGNLRVRTLGLCSSIALGMALGLPRRKVIALDGDGSLLMNLCSLPTIARMNPPNLLHIVFDNGIYEASGRRPTATSAGADLVAMARGAGIKRALWADSVESFDMAAASALRGGGLTFIGVKVEPVRAEVAPYPMDEVENKYRFIRYVEKTEGIQILKSGLPASYSK